MLALCEHLLNQGDVSVEVYPLAGKHVLELSNICMIPLVGCGAEIYHKSRVDDADAEEQAADQHLVKVRVTRADGDITCFIFKDTFMKQFG